MREYKSEKINDFLSLTECTHTYVNDKGETKTGGDHGWWLYDETFGMNLAMRAKTKEGALVEALLFYQKYYIREKNSLSDLQQKVNSFLRQFEKKDEEE
jgi:hypothetical protein